ncbi:MAG: flagellin lysine-N-methylase [Lachnospiraceae bacterium]|nr:flagellin lysine-N-methylase [Lachnospiraceae bacterium]
MKMFRPEFVDEFQCIAERCSYTCCSGWDVIIDCDTYNNNKQLYEDIERDCFFDAEDGEHFIKMREKAVCPFLNEKGLCKIVMEHGEDALSHTCKIFPRMIMGSYDEVLEYSVDNGCPAVLDLLRRFQTPIKFNLDAPNDDEIVDFKYSDEKVEHLIYRNQMIDLLQIPNMPLWARLYLIYDFSTQLENFNHPEILQKYNDVQWLNDKCSQLSFVNADFGTKFMLYRMLFDLYYKYENQGYDMYIVKLKEFCNGLCADDLLPDWKEFEKIWEKESGFIENFCVNSVFVQSLDGEPQKNILILLFEVIQMRFVLFLWWLYCGKTLSDTDMLNIVCYYARAAGHGRGKIYQWLNMNRDYDIMKKGAVLVMLK